MKKTLILVRHAKSSWDHPGLADFERPLNRRGERDAPGMSARLTIAASIPDAIFSSPAQRARQTALALADGVEFPPSNIRFNGGLYGAAAAEMAAMITEFDEAWETVAIVGHNPGMTNLANRYTGHHIDSMPTSGVAIIVFEASSWKRVAEREGTLVCFDFPKKHRRE